MNAPPAANADLARRNRALLRRLLVVAAAMFGFGFALVPLYEKLCEAIGVNNVMEADAPGNTQVDARRTIRLEFDANARNVPFRFVAAEPVVSVHPGEVRQVVYEVVNASGRTVIGQAVPSYAPGHAAQYFRKLDCFCFTQQTLAPGERRLLPVVFVIDPRVPADVATVTLSYTFFEVERGGG